MSGYLLDTNVVSMLSPSRAEASPHFLKWLQRKDEEGEVFLSAVTVHEIRRGIGLLENKGATAKAAALAIWLDGLLNLYSDKILAFDGRAAALSGSLEAQAIAAGGDPGMADAVIAGIAVLRGLVVVTRNAKHFAAFGVAMISPEEAAPASMPAPQREEP